jgi:hypothetical protein
MCYHYVSPSLFEGDLQIPGAYRLILDDEDDMPAQIDACAAHADHGCSPAKNARELKGSARNAIQGAAWGRPSQQRLRLARIEGPGPERRVVPAAQGHGHPFALVGDGRVPEELEVERRGQVCPISFVGA